MITPPRNEILRYQPIVTSIVHQPNMLMGDNATAAASLLSVSSLCSDDALEE